MSPRIMGIVNANPDSFSDPGARSLEDLVADALAQVEAGADMIDVGGESGVTHVAPVSADEERARILPLVERLVVEGVTVSVDTWKPGVAEAVLAAGASMINDVSGLRDPAIADACARHDARLVVMHTRAEPKVKEFPGYDDVIEDIRSFLTERIELARSRGVADDRIVIDPGPDFAKTPEETVEMLRRLHELSDLEYPMLLALSRKDFVGALTGRRPADRLAGTLGAIAAVAGDSDILRVHDVAAVADFLRVRKALEGDEVAVPALDTALRTEDRTR
jgi:dihydropteroate synthase